MANVLCTIIVPANQVDKGRQLGKEVDAHGHGMFVTGLSANGLAPETHYVSSGLIEQGFADSLNDGLLLYAAAQAGAAKQNIPLVSTQLDAVNVKSNSIVHDGFDLNGNPETPHELFARLGLKIIQA